MHHYTGETEQLWNSGDEVWSGNPGLAARNPELRVRCFDNMRRRKMRRVLAISLCFVSAMQLADPYCAFSSV